MKKRIFAVITLCAAMLFSGCGKSESRDDTASGSSQINAPAAVSSAASDDGSADDVSDDISDSAPESERFEVTPPFFKVTDESTGAVVYMMGSMHVGKPGATYPQKMYDALDECDTLAVEVDIQALETDYAAMTEAVQLLLCEPGTTVADYMGEDYEEIKEKFTEKGLYNPIYDYYIPSMWSSLWSNQLAAECGYDSSCGTDVLLLTYAKEHGKNIDEIESAMEQYAVEANTSAELQMLTLTQTIELTDEEAQEQFDMLYDAWKSADMETLEQLASDEGSEDSIPAEIKADYDKYYAEMYTLRQKKMAAYIESKLKSGGKTFVVVGAMHYAAPPDILDYLAGSGYTAESFN